MTQCLEQSFLPKMPDHIERRRNIQTILPSDSDKQTLRTKRWIYIAQVIAVATTLLGLKSYYDYFPLSYSRTVLRPGPGAVFLYTWLGFHRVAQ